MFYGAGMSLQEWAESWSQELQTNEKKKVTEKGQTTSTLSEPVELESVEQIRDEQEIESSQRSELSE